MSDFTRESGTYKGRHVLLFRHKSGDTFVSESDNIAIDQLGHCSVCGAECYNDAIDSDGIVKHFCSEHHPCRSLTSVEAATIAGISRKGILQAIERGKLHAFKHGRDYIIELGDLRAWLASPRVVGRPIKK